MDELFRNLSGQQFLGFVAVLVGVPCITIASLAGTIAPHWRRVRQVEAELQLKRDLVAAGFTADDIERVIRTSASEKPQPVRVPGRVIHGQ